jgi:hypothetical protein
MAKNDDMIVTYMTKKEVDILVSEITYGKKEKVEEVEEIEEKPEKKKNDGKFTDYNNKPGDDYHWAFGKWVKNKKGSETAPDVKAGMEN